MDIAMKILYETKLQHKDINFINIQYVNKMFEKKNLHYLHMNLDHWLLTSLHPTNTYMPCILYDSKIPRDIMLCEN